jgi:hypothetical protein
MKHAALAFALPLALAGAARADDPAGRGWVFLADVQGSLAFANGYPNDIQKIGDPAYETTTGATGGGVGTFAALASLHPRVAFGLWGAYGAAMNGTYATGLAGGGVRVELLPFSEGWLAPVGLHGSFGVGNAKAERRDGVGDAAGTTQSAVALGVFRDTTLVAFEGSRLTWGPSFGYSTVFSRDFARHAIDAGVRLAYVTNP